MKKKVANKSELIQELQTLLKSSQNNKSIKRIQCVFFQLKYDKTPDEISEMVGYHTSYVKTIQAKYWKQGTDALFLKNRGGRRRENLTLQAEKNIIDKFQENAQNAEILDVYKIKKYYEGILGKEVNKTTIYRMLDRHDWRKITPRPTHPKSSLEAMENFKK